MTRISILTGKESRAFIVRRIVFGCLSRDGGPRGEVRRVISREQWERSAQGRGRGEGKGKEGEEGGGREEHGVENEDREGFRGYNRHAKHDLHRGPASLSLLALCLSTSPPIQLLQLIFPLNTLRFFRPSRTFG